MSVKTHDQVAKEACLGILNEIEDGYIELDLNGNITFTNKSFAEMLGYAREELMGMNYRSYMDSRSAEKCFNAFNQVFRTGVPERSFVYEVTRKNKEKRYVEYSISLLRKVSQESVGFRSIIRDITEKKRAEEQIAKQKSLLKATFRSVQDAIITVDTKGKIVGANRAASTTCGVSHNHIKDKIFPNCFTRCNQACSDVLKETLTTNRTVREFQIECEMRNRPMQKVLVTSSPLLNKNRCVIGAVMAIRDVTRLLNLEEELADRHHFRNIIGKSKRMREVFGIVERLADVESTLLITGESGTGKEVIARALHHSGHRAFENLVTVNCAALAENLLESELFGHIKGAFTGAARDAVGRFQMADGGTILLDEIGDISHRIQVKLLRVLQEKQFERVGDSKPIQVDVRIIAATNKDLKAKVASGAFREDLYYRLKVVDIDLPPLRERKEDIPLLVSHFSKFFRERFNKPSQTIPDRVYELLLKYDWPGNVRELKHTVERLYVLSGDRGILPDFLPPEITGASKRDPLPGNRPSDIGAEDIKNTLKSTDWNVSKAARRIGISRRTLYRKIHCFGLQRPSS